MRRPTPLAAIFGVQTAGEVQTDEPLLVNVLGGKTVWKKWNRIQFQPNVSTVGDLNGEITIKNGHGLDFPTGVTNGVVAQMISSRLHSGLQMKR